MRREMLANRLPPPVKHIRQNQKSGEIVLAYRDSSIPFSYIANTPNQPVGYAHDLQLKVVDAVKKELNMPNLKVRYNLVTSQTRIPLVQTVQLTWNGSTTNNEERQKQVDFSVGFFEIGTRLITAKDSAVKDFADSKAKPWWPPRVQPLERFIKNSNEDKKLGINIVSAKDHGESFLMLESDRAAAFMMDDVLLAGEKPKPKIQANGKSWVHHNHLKSMVVRYVKVILHLLKLVDDTLKQLMRRRNQPNLQQVIASPIPPKNVNMNFTMSDNLKNLLAKSTWWRTTACRDSGSKQCEQGDCFRWLQLQ